MEATRATARAMAKHYHQPLQPLLLIGLWTIFCYGTKKKEVLLVRVRESKYRYKELWKSKFKDPIIPINQLMLIPYNANTNSVRQYQ